MKQTNLETPYKLINDTYMKYGKHAGKKLEDIPAHYLLWMRGWIHDKKKVDSWTRGLFNYINDNLEVLQKEADE